MDLKQFISQTLIEISEGIAAASNPVAEAGGSINPPGDRFDANRPHRVQVLSKGQALDWKDAHTTVNLSSVDFDVAVTVTNEKGSSASGGAEGGGKLNVGVATISLGGKARGEMHDQSGHETASRIRFSVDVLMPEGKLPDSWGGNSRTG